MSNIKFRHNSLFTVLRFIAIVFCIFSTSFLSAANKDRPVKNTKIKISVGNQVLTATIYDNSAAHDFLSLLPMKLPLKDYASTEKVSDLPKKLSTKDAPSGSTPSKGDIGYYAPWGNLALYYKDFPYSEGLIILGKIDSNIDVLKEGVSLEAKFELAE